MFVDEAQRHFFDKGDINTALLREVHQIQHFILIATLENDGIEPYPIKICRDCGVDTGYHLVQVAVPGELSKPAWLQAIQTDVNALYAKLSQCSSQALQLGAVGG